MGHKKSPPADKGWDRRISGVPSTYFEDPLYAKYEKRLKRMREAYKEKREKEIQEMENKTIHWLELARVKRVIGQLNGIVKMIEEGDPRCREMANQLKSVSTVTRKIALHVLRRHDQRCLSKDEWKGTEAERLNEIQFTAKAILDLIEEIRVISKTKDAGEEKIFEKLQEKFKE